MMGSATKSKEESEPRNSLAMQSCCFAGILPTAACFVLSVSSISLGLLLSSRTSHLEHRVKVLEAQKSALFLDAGSELGADGTVLTVRDAIDKLLQEVMPSFTFSARWDGCV